MINHLYLMSLAVAAQHQQENNQNNRRYYHKDQSHNNTSSSETWQKVMAAGAVGLATASAAFAFQQWIRQESDSPINMATALEGKEKGAAAEGETAGQFIEGMKVYTANDVAKHQDEKTGIWMVYNK